MVEGVGIGLPGATQIIIDGYLQMPNTQLKDYVVKTGIKQNKSHKHYFKIYSIYVFYGMDKFYTIEG